MKVEVDVVDRATVAIAVDEEQPRAADPLDRRNVELAVATPHFDVGGAEPERPLVRGFRILHPEGHRAGAGAMRLGIFLGIGAGLGIDDEVAVGLLVQRDVLALVPSDLGKTHPVNSERSSSMSGAVYSTNSKPSVPIGFSRPRIGLFSDLRGHHCLLCGPTALAHRSFQGRGHALIVTKVTESGALSCDDKGQHALWITRCRFEAPLTLG